MTNKIEEMTFEQAFAALNETLEKLEAGDLPLAEAMSAYEYGMALAKHCGVQLDTAGLKIKKLNPSGELEDM
ncbi:MAG TPA: exodeoxyribonuclease VII small subunit [Chloroflexi bacterium]|nr:MAG: exodeoxyribonuclease VII small subunit [Anaerolineaceae bacterium 4572_5.2]HEY83718.1 exodeoxyribonuclease VII small subunit [Chloroflexota bacterium]